MRWFNLLVENFLDYGERKKIVKKEYGEDWHHLPSCFVCWSADRAYLERNRFFRRMSSRTQKMYFNRHRNMVRKKFSYLEDQLLV